MRHFWTSCAVVMMALLVTATIVAGISTAALAQEKTLRVRFYDDPAGFDPTTIFRVENENIAFNIFSGLTTYDSKTGKIVPDLAESWLTPDNITWTFKLRKGVKWQKGYGEFTAADVVYSMSRFRDPATASPYATELLNIDTIETPDEYTVVFKLKSPDGNFVHTVANYHTGQVMNQKAVEAAGKQVRWQPVGTGPFYLDSIDVNSKIVLKRNADYFRGPAPIETIIFQIIKDEATGTIALRKGEVDLVMRSTNEQNLQTLAREGFKMNKVENYSVSLMVMNPKHKALADLRVRRAIAHAIDWDAIIKATSPSLQNQGFSMIMPWMDIYEPDVPRYAFDQALAKKLLAEAGYPQGVNFKFLSTSAQGVTELQQFMIDYLSQVGIKMEMELVDTPTFNQRRNNGDFDTTTRLLPAVNPDMVLFNYIDPANMPPKGLNGARYDNPQVFATLTAAKAETDVVKRKAMYSDVQKKVMTDLPYVPVYNNSVIWPSKQSVSGVNLNYLAQLNFFEVDMK